MGRRQRSPLEVHADKIARAEEILDYEFENEQLLCDALTHPSAQDKYRSKNDYERLEFLGDSILGAITASFLFNEFTDLDEGGLTRIKVSLVSGSSLSRVASEQGLEDCIIFGESEQGTDRRGLASALENVYEAIVAALYLDGGLDTARTWIARSLLVYADKGLAAVPESPKSSLQEVLQNRGKQPEYRIVSTDGPAHAPVFTAEVLVNGETLGTGSGTSKKQAEAEAAAAALEKLG